MGSVQDFILFHLKNLLGRKVVLLMFFCMVSMVIVLWQVNAIPGNGCGIQGQNYVAWFQEIEMPVGFHYRNLILVI